MKKIKKEVTMKKTIRYVNSLTFQLELTAKVIKNLAEKFYYEDVYNHISFEEYIVMDTIVCYPHIDEKILAKTLMTEQDKIHKVITSLNKKKLIKELKYKNNEIMTIIYELTDVGNKTYQDMIPESDKTIATLAKFITEKELLSFTKTLIKIRNILISLEYA